MDTNPRETPGSNLPPLDAITTAILEHRQKALLDKLTALQARATWRKKDPKTGADIWTDITTAEEIATAADVIADGRALWHEAEKVRKETKGPYDDVVNTIQGFFNTRLLTPITEFGLQLNGMMTQAQRRLDDLAEQRRLALIAEARKNERSATLIDANAATAPLVRGAPAEDVAERKRDRAAELRQQAELTQPKAIVGASGAKAGKRTVWHADIEDLQKALAYCLTVDQAGIREKVQEIVDRMVRAKVRTIAGVKIYSEEIANVSRR